MTNSKLAFVFPGQGAQSIGMTSELSKRFPSIKKTFSEATDILGYDLWELVQEGPAEKLDLTNYTQPALLVAEIAIWQVWREESKELPSLLAGHSLGEYSALVCAEAISFADAVRLVAERGRLMQTAVPAGQGAMAAIIGLEDAVIHEICDEASEGEVVSAANFNSIGQVVIAGKQTAVDRAIEKAKAHGAKIAKKLPVSVPSHCFLMQPAAEQFLKYLEKFKIHKPKIPVIHNSDVKTHEDPNQIKIALVEQLYSPVQWVKTIQKMAEQGIEKIVDCGPGKVLTGLNKRITDKVTTLPLYDLATLDIVLGK
ncbi:MAG: ACP S-malonyltransferase [Proteobacteria bacterium]|nr:ACP S-malonyltransferase [Pseudomonadota bacterium]